MTLESTQTRSPVSSPPQPAGVRKTPEDRVREQAYYIWEKEGRPQGRELDHWLRAEQKVRRLVDAATHRRQVR